MVATVLVTVPVVLSQSCSGAAHEQWMTCKPSQHWLAAHRRPMTFYPLTILGMLVTLDALVSLLS